MRRWSWRSEKGRRTITSDGTNCDGPATRPPLFGRTADTVWRIVGKRGCVLAVETVLGCYVFSTCIDTQQRRKDMLI